MNHEQDKPEAMKVGVTPYETSCLWDVYLDGVKQKNCIGADRVNGFVVRYVCNEQTGSIELNPSGTEAMTELVICKVEFVRAGRPYKTH